ncbi:MAG: PAS-domain containing protein [Holosporales bacterium]|jgi:signal transduction histidine kinase|nr:PAS-domain containing protein [Holosporales bacterium]
MVLFISVPKNATSVCVLAALIAFLVFVLCFKKVGTKYSIFENRSLKAQLAFLNDVLNKLEIPVWSVKSGHTYFNKCASEVNKALEQEGINLLSDSFNHENESDCIRRFVTINGVYKLLEFKVKNDGDQTVGYCIDRSYEQKILDDLRSRDQSYESIFGLFLSGVAVFDNEMNLVFVNDAYKKITGIKDREMAQNGTFQGILDLLRHNRKLPEVVDFLEYKNEQIKLFFSLTAPMQDFVYLTNGRTLRKVTAPSPMGGLVTILEDITEKINLERQYNTLIAVQKETLDHLFEGIMVFGSNNRLYIINAAAEKIWPSPYNSVGTHISNIVEGVMPVIEFSVDRDEFKSGLISNLTDRIEKQGRLVLKNSRIIQFSYVPLPDGSHLHSYIDVTDSYKVESAFFEKTQALEQTMQVKNDFLLKASSELREPLSVIMGFSQLLRDQYYGELNDKQSRYVQEILEGSEQLLNLTGNMIVLASLQMGQVVPKYSQFNLLGLFKEILKISRQKASDKNIKINISNIPNRDMEADKELIKQATIVLLFKIIKSSDTESVINVKVMIASNSLDVQVLCPSNIINKADKILYKDSDNVDECIYNSNSVSLPLFNHIIKLHKGTVIVENDKNSRTYVRFTIPLNYSNTAEA